MGEHDEAGTDSGSPPVLLPDVTVRCPNCGYEGPAEPRAPGKTWLEAVFWVAFLVPGLCYSIWRIFRRTYLCPRCKSAGGEVRVAPQRRIAMVLRAVLLVAFVGSVIVLLLVWQIPTEPAAPR